MSSNKYSKLPTIDAEGNIIQLEKATVMQEENIVLRDINFKIGGGEMVYLTGKVGSGKSSLQKTLYGEIPFSGTAGKVCGFDLSKLNSYQIP